MATHWPEIALIDYGFKLVISVGLFLPAYGQLLRVLELRIIKQPEQQSPI